MKNRIWELDFLRGLCVTAMIFDHVLYDLSYVFDAPFTVLDFYFAWEVRTVIRIVVVLSFVLLCGISCSFSRSNFLRAGKLAGVALALSIVTKIVDLVQGEGHRFIIVFGVLHMLAASILIYAVLERFISRKHILTIGIVLTAIGTYYYYFIHYAPSGFEALSILVNLKGGIPSADYFPILPGAGILLIGAYFGPLLYGKKTSKFPLKGEGRLTRPFLFAGRHALIFYLLHQPLVLGILALVFLIIGII